MRPSQQNSTNEFSSLIETMIHLGNAENWPETWRLYCRMDADDGGERQ